ncbi:ABC transporter substrate-binding protein [Tessaracoccus lubricantis]|uniref:ABC transporter substrate-binding protein n=1 Tax=Tessaracoccus lubricantis TaxID=545543 RepID=UPI0031E57314
MIGAACLLASALAIAGCSGGPSAQDSPPEITALITTEQDAGLQEFYDDFAEETSYSFDPTTSEVNALVEQLRIQINSGTAPDVLRASLGSLTVGVLPLADEGALADLTSEPWVDRVPESYRGLLQSDDKIWAYPTSGQAIVMFYNKPVFERVGVTPPSTWSEFLQVCQDLKDAGTTPIAQGLGTPAMVQFIPYMLAATLVSAENPDIDEQMRAGDTSFVDDPGWNDVFTKYVELIDLGYITPDAIGVTLDGAMQQTAAGEAAMVPLVSSNSPVLLDYFEDRADVGVFALPATDDPDDTHIPLSPELLALNAEAKNPDGAKAWFEFLSDPQRAAEYADRTNTLPVLEGVTPVQSELGDVLKPFLTEQRFTPFVNHRWVNGDTQAALLQNGPLLASHEITIPELLAAMDSAYQLG